MKHSIIIKITVFLIFNLFLSFLMYSSPAYAGIVLRIVGVNPNDKLTQTVELKTYLPEEVEPDDVIEMGDLQIVYDTQKGAYYVFGEYSLKPNASITREIEIRDIWTIPDAALDGMRNDTDRTVDLLKSTPFGDRAIFIREGIEEKLNEIARRQKVVAGNPQKHIYNFRKNAEILESVKTDLILLKSMFGQSKPLPADVIWKVFIGIVGFLALIGFTLFLFWRKRINSPTIAALDDEPLPEEGESPEAQEVQEGASDEEKKE